MSRRPNVRSTSVACRQCGTELVVHLPALLYERVYKDMGVGGDVEAFGLEAWGVSCPGPECDGIVVVTVGDLHRAA